MASKESKKFTDTIAKAVNDLRARQTGHSSSLHSNTIQNPSARANTLPKHVAIIMDGNGRWAAAKGLPRAAGHREGVEAAKRAIKAAKNVGLKSLTLYSFSTENWQRPQSEVSQLMTLLRTFILTDLPKLKRENIRIRIIGQRENLPEDIKKLVIKAEQETKDNSGYNLQIAFNYGGRDEVVRAIRKLGADLLQGAITLEDITEDMVSNALDTHSLDDPDLVIRTSGEKRISNFLLWQAAYAEYVFMDLNWPDFNEAALLGAIEEYQLRSRRYGGRPDADSK
ncbi:MAG: isoprenyl transferase [bacterium]